jgi:tetratricopeptide (TPR) repeat protein
VSKDNDLAHLNLGMIFADQKHLDDAIGELQGVVARHPNDVDARLKLGNALSEREGRMNDAIREYEAAARLGLNPDVETELANLLLAKGRAEDAVRYYLHVAQIEPSSALAQYNLAVGLHRLGRFSEAIEHYKEVLRIDPKYPDAEYFLGEALLQNGQEDEAKAHLKK